MDKGQPGQPEQANQLIDPGPQQTRYGSNEGLVGAYGKNQAQVPPTSSVDRIVRQAARERENQCSAASLRQVCEMRIKDAIAAQAHTDTAARYLELADRHPEVADMIELARQL